MEKVTNDFIEPFLEAIKFAETLKNLDESQINWKPQPEKWSVASNLNHLSLTIIKFLPHLEKALEVNEKCSLDNISYKYNLIEKLYIRGAGPNGIKIPAPKPIKPTQKVYQLEIIDEFIESQNKMIAIIEKSAQYDISKIRVRSFLTSLFKMKIPAWFDGLPQHQVRHFNQIKAILNHPDFPS